LQQQDSHPNRFRQHLDIITGGFIGNEWQIRHLKFSCRDLLRAKGICALLSATHICTSVICMLAATPSKSCAIPSKSFVLIFLGLGSSVIKSSSELSVPFLMAKTFCFRHFQNVSPKVGFTKQDPTNN